MAALNDKLVNVKGLRAVINWVKDSIANNLTTTASGKVLDARQGKALKDICDGYDSALDSIGLYVSNGSFYIKNS